MRRAGACRAFIRYVHGGLVVWVSRSSKVSQVFLDRSIVFTRRRCACRWSSLLAHYAVTRNAQFHHELMES